MGSVLNSIDLSSTDKKNGAVHSPEELDAGALFVLKSRGWVPGVLITILQAMVTFYSYNLLSVVLEHHAQLGKRQLRFRDMASDILGPKWGKYFVGPLQIAICYGAVISCILLGGQSLKATIAPPVKGKMFKGLCIGFAVIVSTYFSVEISGYWAFGNQSQPTVLSNFMADKRPLLPIWFLLVTNIFTLMQLVTITVIYLQPTNELFQKWFANPKMDQFSAKNVMPRLVFRSLSVIIATIFAAMLPFFGDIMALFGAFGIIPLDFILPMVFYNLTFKPSKKAMVFWGNTLIAVVSSALVAMGAVASVRQIILDAKTYNLFANM